MGVFLTMPKLDMSMAKGTIVSWLIKEGETVSTGDYIFEVETGKVSIQVDYTEKSGVVLKHYYDEGDSIEVGKVIAFIGQDGEKIPPVQETESAGSEQSEDAHQYDYDIIVIGGGPGGYSCAIKSAQYGKKVLIAEESELGGTCLNRGCIPTKSLIRNARVLETVRSSAEMGISFDNLKFSYSDAAARKNEVVSSLRKDMQRVLRHNGIDTVNAKADITSSHTVRADNRTISAEYIVIATGSRAREITAEHDGSVTFFRGEEILDIQDVPESILISECGIIGTEIAYILWAYGSEVTIISSEDSILPYADSDIARIAEKDLRSKGIKIIKNTGLSELRNGQAVLSSGEVIDCSSYLVAEDREAVIPKSSEYMELDERKYIKIDEYMKTDLPNIYAVGDCTGKMFTAHAASKQGAQLAENLFDVPAPIAYELIPNCIFSQPEAAWLGITEEEAKLRKIPVKVSKKNYATVGKALADNKTLGFVKVIADSRWDEILGVHIAGANATDIIAQAAIAVNSELCISDIAKTAFAHPTFSEAFMNACDELTYKK